jgi:glutamate-1-semialdehyde 2,1-aminomutase
VPSPSSLIARYSQKFPVSENCSGRLRTVIAGGAAHDSWRLEPFGTFFEKSKGAFKWTVEGERVIDFWMGHGALLCGHAFAPVVRAVQRQAEIGLHFGGSHQLQMRWGELVSHLIPGAESVRFTASGTEATLLAIRVARALTGRRVIVKVDGHFHGWHDAAMAHFVDADSAGFDTSSTEEVRLASSASKEALSKVLDDTVAGIILEPGGGGSGALPYAAACLNDLKALARGNGSVLIFDETVSGFRYSPGGVQAMTRVTPDITILGKILAGGLPGAAVSGLRTVMEGFGEGTTREGRAIRIPHTGTFNGNPLSAAAGIAMLEQIGDGKHQRCAEQAAIELVGLVNEQAEREGVDVALFQQGSIFHILIGAQTDAFPVGPSQGAVLLPRKYSESYHLLRIALLVHGVDSHLTHGWISSAHTPAVIRETATAFGDAFRELKSEGVLPQ